MGEFTTIGLEGLQEKLLEHSEKVDEAVTKMLEKQAEIFVESQKNSIQKLGLRDTGGFERSITAGKIKKDNTETFIEIMPKGRAPHGTDYGGGYSTLAGTIKGKSQGGNVRYATIGYIFEHGTSSIPALPWLTEGNEEAQDKAYEAAEKIWRETVW